MSKYTDLLADPFAEKIYLVRVKPYDPQQEQIITLYYSDKAFVTGTGASPANTVWQPRLLTPVQISKTLTFEGRLRGFAAPDAGDIVLASSDDGDGNNLDELILYFWDGYDIEIFLGGPDFSFSEFGTLFTGKTEAIEYDFETLTIRIRDQKSQLQKSIQTNEYGGTGGTDGPSSLKDEIKPLCYGECLFEPIYLGVVNGLETFQYHDAANFNNAGSFIGVTSNGVSLTEVGTRTALDGSPSAGEFTVDETQGILQIGGSIGDTVILCETIGGEDDNNNEITKPGEVIEFLVTKTTNITFSGTTVSDFDDNFTDSGQDVYRVDQVIKEETQTLDVVSDILEAIGGFMTFDGSGNAVLGRLEEPRNKTIDFTFDDSDIFDVRLLSRPPPVWRAIYKYARNWRPLQTSEIASSVGEDERAARLKEYANSVTARDTRVQNEHERAQSDVFRVNLKEGPNGDVSDEAGRTLDLFKKDRRIYEIDVGTRGFNVGIGDFVSIDSYSRMQLDQGESFIVIGVDIDGQTNTSTLRLWGGQLLLEILTENGDFLITESGDKLITER